jgi:hypothetical protein
MKGAGEDRLIIGPDPGIKVLLLCLLSVLVLSAPTLFTPCPIVLSEPRRPAICMSRWALDLLYRRGAPWPALHLPPSHSSTAGQPTLLLPFSRLLFHGPAPILLPRLTQASTGPEPIFSIFTLPTPLTHHDHRSLQSRCALPRAPAFPRCHHSLGAGLPGSQHLPAHAGLTYLGWSDFW